MLKEPTFANHHYYITGLEKSRLVIIDTYENKIIIYNRNPYLNKKILKIYTNEFPDFETNSPYINSKRKALILRDSIFLNRPYYIIYKFKKVFIPDIITEGLYTTIINNCEYLESNQCFNPILKGSFILVNLYDNNYILIDDGISYFSIPEKENINFMSLGFNYNTNQLNPYAFSENYIYYFEKMLYFNINDIQDFTPLEFLDNGFTTYTYKKWFLWFKKRIYLVIIPFHLKHKFL